MFPPINTTRELQEMCKLASAANLRALLRNETLLESTVFDFLNSFIEIAYADNGEAVSVLLEDGRCFVEPYMLDIALRKEKLLVAAALLQHDEVRASMRACADCNVNIGAYECFNGKNCKSLPKPPPPGMNTLPDNYKLPKYCRACALAFKTFCKCGEVICFQCLDGTSTCLDCDTTVCGQDDCVLLTCSSCEEERCESCTVGHSAYCSYEQYSDDYYHDPRYGGYFSSYGSDSDYY